MQHYDLHNYLDAPAEQKLALIRHEMLLPLYAIQGHILLIKESLQNPNTLELDWIQQIEADSKHCIEVFELLTKPQW